MNQPRAANGNPSPPVLEARELTAGYASGGWWRRQQPSVLAVREVNLQIRAGESLGLVGESGCGKSTLGRTLLRLQQPSSGQVLLHGTDITRLGQTALRPWRRDMQMIWQDPSATLSPRRSIAQSLLEPLEFHRIGSPVQRQQAVTDLLERVGLDATALKRYPHEFSGGQRQRISIARALTLQPSLLIADEPVSSLDVSVQSQILNLLRDLVQEMGLAMLFISHDLAVVQHVSDRVAVMYLGRLVEVTDRERLFNQPLHPYTQALLLASPIPQPRRRPPHAPLQGELPSLARPPAGCPFHTRCPKVMPRCRNERPEMIDYGQPGRPHLVACHLHEVKETPDAQQPHPDQHTADSSNPSPD